MSMKVLATAFPDGCPQEAVALLRLLVDRGLVTGTAPGAAATPPQVPHDNLKADWRDIKSFARNILVTAIIFTIIAIPAIGIEYALIKSKQGGIATEELTKFLETAKTGIMTLDLALLFTRLVNHGWKYIKGLRWR
jgi:hypothetical protein